MRLRAKGTRAGFTLIELSFAIAFISVLLITVTLITNEIVSIYRKGYSIKTVNQVGRDLIDDIQNSITQSPPASISSFCGANYDENAQDNCKKNNGFYSVYQQFYVNATINNSELSSHYVPIGGIFCSGKYSYVWNSGYLFNGDNDYNLGRSANDLKLKVKYKIGSSGQWTTAENFRLLKIEDSSREICSATLTGPNGYPSTNVPLVAPGTVTGNNREVEVPSPLSNEPEDILRENDASLAIFDFVVFEPARVANTNRLLFSGSFILGTTTGSVDIMTSSNFCKAPTNFSADFNYCAINKFNFTVQASGN